MEGIDDGALDAGASFRDERDARDARPAHLAHRFILPNDRGVASNAIDQPPISGRPKSMDEWWERPSHREWMDAINANCKSLKKCRLRVANAERSARAFGLAWMNPENLASYATAARIEPNVLRDALGADDGMRIAVAMEAQLQASGEAQQVLMAKSLPGLITAIEKSESMSEATALKPIDIFSKGRESAKAAEGQPIIPPAVFTGTAAELIVEITAAGDEARALADFDPGNSRAMA